MGKFLTDDAKRILDWIYCTACGLGMIYVAVSTLVGMEPQEFWGL